jgi:hypothetical protein
LPSDIWGFWAPEQTEDVSLRCAVLLGGDREYANTEEAKTESWTTAGRAAEAAQRNAIIKRNPPAKARRNGHCVRELARLRNREVRMSIFDHRRVLENICPLARAKGSLALEKAA